MSNSEASQTDGYPKDWQIQDLFILFALCITPYNQSVSGWNEQYTRQNRCCTVFRSASVGNNQSIACSFGLDVYIYIPKWHQGERREAGEVHNRGTELSGI